MKTWLVASRTPSFASACRSALLRPPISDSRPGRDRPPSDSDNWNARPRAGPDNSASRRRNKRRQPVLDEGFDPAGKRAPAPCRAGPTRTGRRAAAPPKASGWKARSPAAPRDGPARTARRPAAARSCRRPPTSLPTRAGDLLPQGAAGGAEDRLARPRSRLRPPGEAEAVEPADMVALDQHLALAVDRGQQLAVAGQRGAPERRSGGRRSARQPLVQRVGEPVLDLAGPLLPVARIRRASRRGAAM